MLAQGETVVDAAQKLQRSARVFYLWRDRDERFAAAWTEAEKLSIQPLEAVARERAIAGSDTLLMFLLKKRDPSYRENARVELTGADGGPIQHEHKVVSLAAVVSLADELGVLDQLGLEDRLRPSLPAAREVLPASAE